MLEPWPVLFGSVDVSEAFVCCSDPDDSGTIQQPSQTAPAKRSNFSGNHSSEVAAATLSCMCPEPLPLLILSSEQSPTIPTKPLEIFSEEAIRTILADGGEEESETVA